MDMTDDPAEDTGRGTIVPILSQSLERDAVMSRRIRSILSIAALSGLPLAAAAAELAIDPAAAQIAQRSAEFLAAQERFSFNWFVSFDDMIEGPQKITRVRSGHTVMQRNHGFVATTERDDTLRDYYYDGAAFTVASPNERFYATAPFTGSFDALVNAVRERSGSILPLWSIMSETLPNVLLDDIQSATYLGVTLIAGREAHHLAFTEAKEDWQVWVSIDENAPLPLMLVGTDKTEEGWPQYLVYLMDWNLAPEIDPAAFRFAPSEGDVRVAFPALFPPAETTATGQ